MQAVDLYAKREKIQARDISGFFQNIRLITILGTFSAFVLLPWLRWDHRQALLFDLPNRRFYVFGWTFWPQDFVLLSWLLIIAAFALFFFTMIAGRVFCGYTCPQTVWTRLFMWIEHFAEGDRNARLRLDAAPASANKFLRRSIKHSGWLLISLLTGLAFVGYFSSIDDLGKRLALGQAGGWEIFWILFFTCTTYLNAGWMREQICMYMCPYGRFQSVMIDSNTLVISYDAARGDPRGKRKKNTSDPAIGDCVDCTLCVQVCPTGIDIRDGLQFECIQCAACIDACDSIMDKMGYERGLVRYTTDNALHHKASPILRPRLLVYAVLLVLMGCAFLYTLGSRVPLAMEVSRDRNRLYRETDDGRIENVYMLKIMNMSQEKHRYVVILTDNPGDRLNLSDNISLQLQAGEIGNVPVRVNADPNDLDQARFDVHFRVAYADHPQRFVLARSRFIAPDWVGDNAKNRKNEADE